MEHQYLATRAPDNDAAEDAPAVSFVPNDFQAQSGASVGEHCVTDRPISSSTRPSGEMTKMGITDVYISKPADYPHASSKLLLLLTGGTGVYSTNNQLQADKYAAEGFVVVMPDQFNGDPYEKSVIAAAGQESSLLERFKVGIAETAKAFTIDMWLARHTQEKVLPILRKVLDIVKDEYADAVANGDGIYGAGYCFGAKYIILLAGEHPDTVMHGQGIEDEESGIQKAGPLLRAGVAAHGTLVTKELLNAIKVPISLVCVENDAHFPAETIEAGRTSLESNRIEHEIRIYPEVPHGKFPCWIHLLFHFI